MIVRCCRCALVPNPSAVVRVVNVTAAALQAALVRRAGHRLHVEVDEESLTATATLHRSDDPDTAHKSTWTQAKAERAGLWGRGAWTNYPSVMLANRATTEVIRRGVSDVLLGAAYSPDELEAEPAAIDVETPDEIEVVDVPVMDE